MKVVDFVQCRICEHKCNIGEGSTGICRMYTQSGGVLREKYPGRFFACYPVSSESIPLLHFMPNGKFLLVSTIGCNFRCPGCVSEMIISNTDSVSRMLKEYRAEEILDFADREDCSGVVFCLNEPSVSYYTFLNLVEAAKDRGLLAGCSTNGYLTERALLNAATYLDFVNVGLKGSGDGRYRECGAVSSGPVFRNIRMLYEKGVHVELSVMHLSGRDDEVIAAARTVGEISRGIPFQIMPFVPHDEAQRVYQPETIDSEKLCTLLERYLDYVYVFNTPGTERLNTYCPECGRIVIKRKFNGPMAAKVISYREGGVCECKRSVGIKGEIKEEGFAEPRYLGGYRTTRALDTITRYLETLGVTESSTIIDAWVDSFESGYFETLHERISTVNGFFENLRHFARMAGKEKEYDALYGKYRPVIDDISQKARGLHRPPVYSIMAKPVLALYRDKSENDFISIAGGRSINTEISMDDRSNPADIDPEIVNAFEPEFVFVGGKRDGDPGIPPEVWKDCGFDMPALRNNRVYRFYYPDSDNIFSWILTLMDIANRLHPEVFSFDLEKEAEKLGI